MYIKILLLLLLLIVLKIKNIYDYTMLIFGFIIICIFGFFKLSYPVAS